MISIRFRIRNRPLAPPHPTDCGLVRLIYEIGVYYSAPRDGCFGEPDESICAEQIVAEREIDDAIPFVRRHALEELTRRVLLTEEEVVS